MEMLDKYRKFTSDFILEAEGVNDGAEALDLMRSKLAEAKKIKRDDYEEIVVSMFSVMIEYDDSGRIKEIIKKGIPFNFIKEMPYFTTEQEEFLSENWDNLDDILQILKKYIEKK